MKATIRDVIRMREDGRPRKWIVRETGLHWMTVRSMLSLAGNPPQKQEVYNEKAYDVAEKLSEVYRNWYSVARMSGLRPGEVLRYFPHAFPEQQGPSVIQDDYRCYRKYDVFYVLGLAEMRKPPSVIADVTGFDEAWVRSVLAVGGFRSQAQTNITVEQYENVKAAVEDDWPFAQIESTYGITRKNVRLWFDYSGLTDDNGLKELRSANALATKRKERRRG